MSKHGCRALFEQKFYLQRRWTGGDTDDYLEIALAVELSI